MRFQEKNLITKYISLQQMTLTFSVIKLKMTEIRPKNMFLGKNYYLVNLCVILQFSCFCYCIFQWFWVKKKKSESCNGRGGGGEKTKIWGISCYEWERGIEIELSLKSTKEGIQTVNLQDENNNLELIKLFTMTDLERSNLEDVER